MFSGDFMASIMEEKLPWWMNPDYLIGKLVHKPCNTPIYVYYRSLYPDDDRYALIVWENDGPKLLCEMWLGRMLDE